MMLLVAIVTGARATDFVDTYGSLGTVTGDYIANGISKIALGENATASSGIQASNNGATMKFTVSTATGFTIKTVRFKNSNVSGTPSTNDAGGTVNVASSYTTYTASSNKSSVEFTVASSSGKKAKLTEFTVTVTGEDTEDYELITPTGIDDGVISYTSSLGDGKLVTAMGSAAATYSSGSLDFGNGKGFSITTSRPIKAVYCVWHQRQPSGNDKFVGYSSVDTSGSSPSYSGQIGTYTNSTNAWVADDEETTFVAFKRGEGSSARLSGIHIFYYASNVPSISAGNLSVFESTATAGEIDFTVKKLETTGTVTAETTADWVTLGDVDNENSKAPFTVTANTTGDYRSATVTLTYTYNTSETVTKDITITQSPDFSGKEIIKAIPKSQPTGAIGGTGDYNAQDRKNTETEVGCKLGSKGHYIGITLGNGETFKADDVVELSIGIGISETTEIIFYDSKEQTNVILATGVNATPGIFKFVLPEAANGKTSLYLVRGTEVNTDFNPFVDYIAVTRPNATITLNANGYATYSNAEDFEFAGAQAYTMALTTTSLQGTEVTGKIPAGEGILFKGEAGAKVAIINTTGAEALEGNSLIGTTDAEHEVISPLSYTYKYALSGDTFKKFTGSLVANKAFFGTNEELSNSLDLVFDGDPTAVEAIAEANAANAEAPVKVIKNGQLYIGNFNVAGQQVK